MGLLHFTSTKKSFPSPTRPDSSGIAVEALATQNKAAAIRTDSGETRHDERVITVLCSK